ncbi:uncharacterized protein [Panulirus ornatus]|uniref:uncharacterized protein n=1 Tax=Panulirus ornatus TaxID=150431 RepID=UPI003A89FF47
MRSAYPLLVDQNGWSVGNCRDPTSLLRSVGVDLSRPAHQTAHHAHHDIEIHVEDPPSSYSHEYPQPQATAHEEAAITQGGAEYRTFKKPGDTFRGSSFNRTVQRLQLSVRPEPDLRLDSRFVEGRPDGRPDGRADSRNQNANSSRSSAASTATPRNSPRTTSPRAAYAGRRLEGVHPGGPLGLEQQQQEPQQNHRDYARGSNGTGSCGVAAPAFTLPTMMRPSRPSQLSLCCSSPDYYYNEERLRQEPEPGLLNCCDTKISCCPCSPCCEPYCPVGHMNTVCMSLICTAIILFIVLSPLFHYLVPT